MPLTATLAIDVTNFERGLENAQVRLGTFDRAAKNSSRDLSRLAEGFSGQKIAVEAARMAEAVERVGGAAKLTEAEQRRVNATVTEAIAKYAALGQTAPASLQKLASDTAKVNTETQSWSSRLDGAVIGAVGGLTAAVTTFGLQAAQAAIRGFGEWTRRGGEVAAMHNSFDALAGGVGLAEARLTVLRMSTRGLVNDMDLMKASNKAVLLDLGLTDGQMGELAKTASILGRAMGQDATSSLNDLITALGRSSPMILDNLGLSVKVGEANEAYAEKLGKTAEALTDAEKKQAFMNAAMDAAAEKTRTLGGLQLTASDRMSQLWVMLKNTSDATASWAVNLPLANRGLDTLLTNMQTLEGLFRGGPKAALEAYKQATGDFIPTVDTLTKSMGFTSQAARALTLSESEMEAAERKLTDAVKESVKAQEKAAKSISWIDGELDPLTRLYISGAIPATSDFATETTNASKAMDDLVMAIARADGSLVKIQPLLKSTFSANALVPFKTAIEATDTTSQGFFGRLKESFGEAGIGANTLSSLFTQAFTGGGGALGAVQAFATQGLAALMGMIPGVGPWISGFAGPIVAMLSKLAAKFKSLFGGPSESELQGRESVAEFEAGLWDTLTAAQAAEAGTDDWKKTVIALRDAYMAAGRTEEEALADAKRLWESSKDGAEAAAQVIAEVKAKLDGLPDSLPNPFADWGPPEGSGSPSAPSGPSAGGTAGTSSAGAVMAARVRAGGGASGGTINVPVYLDGFQIAMAVAPHRNAANRRWGV